MSNELGVKNRKTYLDIIKIVAIIFVIYNHTGNNGFLAFYNTDTNKFVRILELLVSIICKTAVPLFFMCSGALLLKKELSVKNILQRVIRFIIVLIFFSLSYYLYLSIRNNSPIDIKWILTTIYSTTTFSYSGSYWFIYSYIAFLLIIPVLSIIAKNINENIIVYLLVLQGIFSGILPIFEYIMKIDHIALQIPFILSINIIYPIIGYYYDNNQFKNEKLLYGLAFISVFTSGLFTWKMIQNGNPTESYLSLFGIYNVLLIYLTLKKCISKIKFSNMIYKAISEIGKCVFGIFLLHGFVFTIIDDYYASNCYFDCILKTLIIFVICTCITYVLRRIPVIKKYL